MKKEALSNVEILAPAGSYESFLAAIHAGSDAVYLGGTLFSARASAENFTQDQLLKAIDYAHLHGRKVYMTVNTLLKEEELKKLPEYLLPYYEKGLDAVIVQDLGVLKLIANIFPDMAIHLSTQMTLTGSMGANLFEKRLCSLEYPVTRLVPARELSLDEIKKLRQETNLELEVFVHGAICVSYSGQCFFSSMIGGRSGNRGRCAQPCRKLYIGTNKAYLLSPKDLCTLEMIPDLIEAGINSFKIEGRMKKPEYAAYISWLYRKYTDRFFQYGRKEYEAYFKKYPKELEQDLCNMKDLYNRGEFSKGYFFNHNGRNMMSMERPNHAGVRTGKVKAVKGNQMEILWEQEIYPQDILEVRSKGKQIYEYTSGQGKKKGEKSQIKFFANAGVQPGMEVFRTRNNHLLSWIRETIIQNLLKKKLYGEFYAVVGKEVSLTVWDAQEKENKNSITVTGSICQKAQKQPLSTEDVRRQLLKLGDTEFEWEQLDIRLGDKVFLPIKSLNELRRQALEKFQRRYLERFSRKTEIEIFKESVLFHNTANTECEQFQCQPHQFLSLHNAANTECGQKRKRKENIMIDIKPKIAAEVLTKEQWQTALCSDCVYIIYARMEILDKEELISFAEETIKRKKKCFLSLPLILRESDRKVIKDIAEILIQKQLCNGFLLHNIEELGFITEILRKTEENILGKENVLKTEDNILRKENVLKTEDNILRKENVLKTKENILGTENVLKTKENILGKENVLKTEENILEKKEIELVADFSMYSTNSIAMDFWHTYGCNRVTASVEQNFEELQSLFSVKNNNKEMELQLKMELETEILCYGRLPLMVSAQCIASYAKNKDCIGHLEHTMLLNEKKETIYAMNFCRFCYNILYSGKKLDLLNCTEKLLQVPFQVWRCSFTDETKLETKDILDKIEMICAGNVFSEYDKGWTGHFYKGMI